MKILVIIDEMQYQNNNLASLLGELSEQNIEYKILDLNNRDHQETSTLYGIMQTPAVVVCHDNGKPISIWQNELPTADLIALSHGYI